MTNSLFIDVVTGEQTLVPLEGAELTEYLAKVEEAEAEKATLLL